MTRVSLRNLRAHKVRLVLTLVAVVLGTAFIAGSFVFTDTLSGSFSDIFKTSDEGIDAQVRPTHDFAAGVPDGTVAALARVPGVRAVQPQISGPVVFVDARGKRVDTGGAPSVGADWVVSGAVGDPPQLVAGRPPRTADEITVNNSAMSRYHLRVGETGKLVVPNAAVLPVRIVGVYRIGYDTGGYFGALLQRARAASLFTDGRHVPSVDVAAVRGVSETALATRLRAALPAGFEVRTGKQVRDDDTKGVADALSFVTYLLLGFGIVALVVGSFIIYNTFTMLVAQRQRELALLRAIGADRKQVRRSVVREAVIIGLVGSALGVGGGVALAYGLHALLDAFNAGLPSGGLVLSPRTVIVSLVIGTVVTVLAALAPARRAARIAPVAAMREDATPSVAGLRRRTVAGVLVGAVGVAATVGGVAASGAGSQASLTALGLLAVCAAVLLLSPVFARWVIDPLGRLIGRPFGVSGRLARTNAVRNPRRTAATGFALTLGLVLVTGIAVVGASMKASLGKLFDDNVRAAYILTTGTQVQVPLGAAQAARAVGGVASLTELHTVVARIEGATRFGTAVDGPLTPVLRVHLLHGSADTSGQRMIVSETTAKDRHWTMGSSHRLTVPGRPTQTLTVTGIFTDDQLVGDWAVSGAVYRALTPPNNRSDDVALVDCGAGRRPGPTAGRARTRDEQLLHRRRPRPRAVQGDGGEPGERAARAALRAAGAGTGHRGAGHRQHPGPLGRRTPARARHAARRRYAAPAGAPHGAAGVGADRGVRCSGRRRRGAGVRVAVHPHPAQPGPVAAQHPVGAGGAVRGPRRGGGRAGRRLAGAASGPHAAAAGHRGRLTGAATRAFRRESRREKLAHQRSGVLPWGREQPAERAEPDMSLDDGPLDPFLGDPDDPASLLDDNDPPQPLTDDERLDVQADLAELTEFRSHPRAPARRGHHRRLRRLRRAALLRLGPDGGEPAGPAGRGAHPRARARLRPRPRRLRQLGLRAGLHRRGADPHQPKRR